MSVFLSLCLPTSCFSSKKGVSDFESFLQFLIKFKFTHFVNCTFLCLSFFFSTLKLDNRYLFNAVLFTNNSFCSQQYKRTFFLLLPLLV